METPPRVPIVLPELGTDQVRFSLWYVAAGGPVVEGDRVAEVLIPGATCEIASPATGRLSHRSARPNDPITRGQILGEVEVTGFW